MEQNNNYTGVAGIYMIICNENGKVYIGQTNNLRRRETEHFNELSHHKHHNLDIQSDYDRYGKDAFSFTVIESGDYTQEELNHKEKEAIEKYGGIESDKTYNVFSGGSVGYKANQNFRSRISESNFGKQINSNQKELARKNAKKQWENSDYRETMINSAKNQWKNEEYRAKMKKVHTGNPYACGHKLMKEDVVYAREAYKNGTSIRKLSKKFKVAYSTMRNAIAGVTWKSV